MLTGAGLQKPHVEQWAVNKANQTWAHRKSETEEINTSHLEISTSHSSLMPVN